MIVLTITVRIMMSVILIGVIIRMVVIVMTIRIIKTLYTGPHLSNEL